MGATWQGETQLFLAQGDTQTLLVSECLMARSFFERLRGLIGTRNFPMGAGLWLPNCNDIHMWFMSISIDVVFLRRIKERHYEIMSTREGLKPWKVLPVRDAQATDTLELPLGALMAYGLKKGDTICIN